MKTESGKKVRKKWFAPVIITGCTAIISIVLFMHDQEKTRNEALQHSGNSKINLNDIPIVRGKREGCLFCHKGMEGFVSGHNPEALGCSSCHLGDPLTLDKKKAHSGMILIPGNLDNAAKTCGQTDCHAELTRQVMTSLMASGKGMVSVNHYVFNESPTPDGDGNLSRLGKSPADTHLRQLCAVCHLGTAKKEYGTFNTDNIGGGCLACHLYYSKPALDELNHFKRTKNNTKKHPALNASVSDDRCFTCHSRSARISTSYQGLHETTLDPGELKNPSEYRILEDGRVFEKKQKDIHFTKGLLCIDCHTARDVMGDGKQYNHQEEQVEIQCTDCHFNSKPSTISYKDLDPTSLKLLELRKMKMTDRQYILTKDTGRPMINVFRSGNKPFVMAGKLDNKIHKLKAPADICQKDIPGHNRLTCQSCHTTWSPTCVGCHTEYKPVKKNIKSIFTAGTGGWTEYTGSFLAVPPSLGVRLRKGKGVIDSFIPGMVLTINRNAEEGTLEGKSASLVNSENGIFQRLYAPTFSHTIGKKGRSCESCHTDPRAIGFGAGKLVHGKIKNADTGSYWSFIPEYENHAADGLPLDSWTGFLKNRQGKVSTRTGARPFTIEEQIKILRVGSCLQCHKGDSANIKRIYSNFDKALAERSDKCSKD